MNGPCPFVRLVLAFAATGCVTYAPPSPMCTPIEGLDAVIKPGNLVVFGELHGTNEVPAFITDAVCAAAQKGWVHIGLEMPVAESWLLQKFLRGKHDDGLRESEFWHAKEPYGVTSQATLTMLTRFRDMQQQGEPVDVFYFDDRVRHGMEGRDLAMAETISEKRRVAPQDIYLIVTGNFHARKAVGAPFDAKKRWMASFLAASDEKVITLDIRNLPGTAWTCQQPKADGPQLCGSSRLSGRQAVDDARAVKLVPVPELGYDGTFSVGTISSSRPVFPPSLFLQ
jgi:hypothetical protein